MSQARNIRRANHRALQPHITQLAELCGNFYEFLSSSPQPSDEQVRAEFSKSNAQWIKYCQLHDLMNMSQLFIANVREAWNRHKNQ